MEGLLGVGILGAAEVAPRSLVAPARSLPGVEVRGVASRAPEHARRFAEEHGILRAYDSYEALLESAEIDLVYVPLANHLHTEWTVRALRAGKHVLVEKPACLSLEEALRVEEVLAEPGSGHALEALMTQHHALIAWLQKAPERYGPLRSLVTELGFPLPENPECYRFRPGCGGGVFRDEVVHGLLLAQKLFAGEPERMEGSGTFDARGIDRAFRGRLHFPEGSAELICSWERHFIARHRLVYEAAVVEVRNFLRPYFGRLPLPVHVLDHDGALLERVVLEPACYFTDQLAFMAAVIAGERPNHPWSETVQRTRWMEAVYQAAPR